MSSRLAEVVAPGEVRLRVSPVPKPGERDVVVRIRACGICGSDLAYVAAGGMPGQAGNLGEDPLRLGHEPAGEVVACGSAVRGLHVGDRVVVNPMVDATNVIGNGGDQGALADHLLVRDAELGLHLQKFPVDLPWHVAALNEPLAVALHLVNRAAPKPREKVVVFGAGTIGLAAAVWLRLRGVDDVVVVDVHADRLARATAIGAHAVIDAATEDFFARLQEVHGTTTDLIGRPAAGTDVYLDAAGVSDVVTTTLAAAKGRARLVVAALHKAPVEVDFRVVLSKELTITAALGYPDEIFAVMPDLAEHRELFGRLVTHTVDLDDLDRALALARQPAAVGKVVVTVGQD